MHINWLLRPLLLVTSGNSIADELNLASGPSASVYIEKAFAPAQNPNTQMGIYDRRRPVVIWHGLGDNYNSSGIRHMEELIGQFHPEVEVYRIRLDNDSSKDEQSSLVGDMNKNIQSVCEQIGNMSELVDGFDGLGNSQGGLFLRALHERCDAVNIHNLVTFGSPHMGVMDLPLCSDPHDWVCRQRNNLLKKQVWFSSVQHSVIPAQYFRDPYDLEKYMKYSSFLADINNESLETYHSKYTQKMRQLNKFVLVQFLDDTTVVPKTSAQFGDIDRDTGAVIPLRFTDMYKYDVLGLKTLDKKGALELLDLEGPHMQLTDPFLVNIINDYLGSKF
ncbi:alpha/beta-hydrolase [Yamadazyma tenuis ATCC 10573]|uniref:Palmitoyl-protein thioesterase 1 n=1 Tax=Candida tenuis (strain ATCC 10573 / BCRC 21748 / CBS 615 / JCM 9827 / NBRC 10315 / NRRL Y-1498 / VKM Y-70) TaxID=590646 RepID=G3BAT3_CANTC|nr:alpha/beta-hydrolase [Yamadazyma tenuis ATCC 10573]EGV62107.1 alpha/beta-hydrolase [Yamadazyma tenuis ATCC 10573]